MKQALLLLILVALCVPATLGAGRGQVQDSQRNDRFRINSIEPDGFLGLRLGNSFRYAEELLGEANNVRNGSLEWHFSDADFDPYEALTIVGEKRQIIGFVAHLRPNRIQFTDMQLHPAQNRLGTWHASRKYVSGKYVCTVLVVGDDATYARRIILQAQKQ